MAGEYTDRCFIFCTVGNLAAANVAAAAWDPDDGSETFGSDDGCSADGLTPATHYCANTAATTAMVTAIDAAKTVGDLAAVYKKSLGDTIELAISNMGLKKILPS